MALEIGATLGPYLVTARIGAGGMGEVYRARDSQLDRDVALKVLPSTFMHDEQRRVRFEREARVLASLSHPAIGAIYGLQEEGDTRALVLELVEGVTLEERIARGPISLREALPIARQIADALEAAHEGGVIHRDLKPANIKVRRDGSVKVLDFGLARMTQSQPSPDPNASPTLTAGATGSGVVLGTAAYMSPEQAKGQAVDYRCDIWAFGSVLYELLSGQRAFPGNSVSETLAAVLTRDIDLAVLPDDVPASARRLIRRCLERDQRRRLKDLSDGLLHVEEDLSGAMAVSALEVPKPTFRPGRLLPWMSLVALAIAIGFGIWNYRATDTAAPPEAFSIPLPMGVEVPPFAVLFADLSPDGEDVVFVGARDGATQLYRRPLRQVEAMPIAGTEGGSRPFFSPDGEWIGFREGQTLKKVGLAGGAPVTLGTLPPGSTGLAWSDDGWIWIGNWDFGGTRASRGGAQPGLYRVSAEGGVPELITSPEPDSGIEGFNFPRPLPGGRAVLYHSHEADYRPFSIRAYIPETGEHRHLVQGRVPWFASSGHLVFSDHEVHRGAGIGGGGVLWAAPFDVERIELLGEPVRVHQDIRVTPEAAGQVALGRDGTLLYVPGPRQGGRSLVAVDREGRVEALSAPSGRYRAPRWIPKADRRVLVQIPEARTADLHVYDGATAALSRVTTHPSADVHPLVSTNGAEVLFTSYRPESGQRAAVYARATDGGGAPRLLFADSARQLYPWSWSVDGQDVLAGAFDEESGTGYDIGTLSTRGAAEWQPLAVSPAIEVWPELSPDGRWVVFVSSETGLAAQVAPYPEGGGGTRVSPGAAFYPVWIGPKEIAYRDRNRRAMVSVKIREEAGQIVAEPPVELFEDSYFFRQVGPRDFDVASDGRFLMIDEGPVVGAGQISVIRNFVDELATRAPGR